MWYVYILVCEGGSYYVGLTDDVGRRYREHSAGKGGHYTRRNPPTKLAYQESFQNKETAQKREIQIKRWVRAKKKALIEGKIVLLQQLSISRD